MLGLSRALASSGVQGGVWTAFASTCHKEGPFFLDLKNKKN